MKKLLGGLVLLILFLSVNPKTFASTNDVNNKCETSTLFSMIDDAKIIDDQVWYVDGVTYFNEYNISLEEEVIKYFYYENKLYLLCIKEQKYYLKTIDIKSQEENIKKLDGNILDFKYHDNKIYLVGNLTEDAVVYIYNLELETITRYIYGGKLFETFNHIEFIDNQIYLTGYKNGISKDSPFANTGTEEDIKAFVVTVDEKFEITKSFYIDENTRYETIDTMIVQDNLLYLQISDSYSNSYQYVLNNNLEKIEKFLITKDIQVDKIMLVESYNMCNEKIYVYLSEGTLSYLCYTNKISYQYQINKNVDDLFFVKIINGKLNVVYKQGVDVKLVKISEYHIDYIYSKNVYYQDSTYRDTSHFKVNSFFEELTFEYSDTLNNHISLNQCGETVAYYVANTLAGGSVIIDTPYLVHQYINVINNGIYPKDYQLLFSDSAYINDEECYNGQKLSLEGEVTITHVYNGKEQVYKIYVYDQYYKTLDLNYMPSDVVLNREDTYNYFIELSSVKKVRDVVVNNSSFNFLQNENMIQLIFDASETYQLNKYNINYIEFEDGEILNINKEIKIKTKKQLPHIDIYYNNTDGEIVYNVTDTDKSIMDIKIKYYRDGNIIKEELTYLDTYNVWLNNEIDKIEIVLIYEDGTNALFEEVLFELEGSTKRKEKTIFQIEYNRSNSINEIKIKNIDVKKTNIENVSVQSLSMNKIFIKENSTVFPILVGISTFLILVVIVVTIYIKNKKRKINKNNV